MIRGWQAWLATLLFVAGLGLVVRSVRSWEGTVEVVAARRWIRAGTPLAPGMFRHLRISRRDALALDVRRISAVAGNVAATTIVPGTALLSVDLTRPPSLVRRGLLTFNAPGADPAGIALAAGDRVLAEGTLTATGPVRVLARRLMVLGTYAPSSSILGASSTGGVLLAVDLAQSLRLAQALTYGHLYLLPEGTP